MNKSILTNVVALLLLILGLVLENMMVTTIGVFALSGAVTNWLAVHMLFEKVPLLYGSGVIPSRFEEFKAGIRELMMTQFFTEQNIARFLNSDNQQLKIDLAPVLEKVDLEPTFDSLVEVINASSFGSMLGMFGGAEALTPLKQPFVEKMKTSLIEISRDERFLETLSNQLEQPNVMHDVQQKIESIVEQRLNELTPKMVKDIIQAMIKKHLGWLVVWGGVFGGLIGLVGLLAMNLAA
ncbi:MAG: DUF445 domain-containing protein [Alteromonadaceae bacterium]|uniref:DUF445 domain-containing protein n=1 Tax=Paraglaciecola mesophila KMM 241 TaxID=1128912 RepID=K6Z786_9ALTE|nr:DUF445 family protein [Paraglaciecola mesophila]MAD16876.1 DUF445 domain-containing protein [Alteromonadaceae bacterium]MBB19743.1 DUF445 domain-containing protein [Rickettsiales bacterium]GAC24828.1 hypothetical protein GMES_2533 [Paraglaciecola mesophila KMM 241]